VSGCWLAVGVEDRQVVGTACKQGGYAPYPIVEASTTACFDCMTSWCCADATNCAATPDCVECIANPMIAPPLCGNLEALALKSCLRLRCPRACYDLFPAFPATTNLHVLGLQPSLHAAPCGGDFAGPCAQRDANYGTIACDPVKRDACPSNEACSIDVNADNLVRFACRGTGHVLLPGADCGPVEGQCAPGSDCFVGSCYSYCCTDSDCGPDGQCYTILPDPSVGLNLGVCIVGTPTTRCPG